jgi:hypothetical protein
MIMVSLVAMIISIEAAGPVLHALFECMLIFSCGVLHFDSCRVRAEFISYCDSTIYGDISIRDSRYISICGNIVHGGVTATGCQDILIADNSAAAIDLL